jgi:transcriptional regulator with XRE-family HTH domain
MKFSDKLSYLRNKRGLSQTELAKLSNISQQSISHFETGRGVPSRNNAIQLAKVLGVKVDDLMKDERSVTE